MHTDEVIKALDPKIYLEKNMLIVLMGGTNYHSGKIKVLIKMKIKLTLLLLMVDVFVL